MSNIISVDIAGKARVGISCFNLQSKKLLNYSYLDFEKDITPREHRDRIIKGIQSLSDVEDLRAIIFERINLYRNSKISLDSILSLARVQTSIIDAFGSEDCKIFDVNVQSWKSRVLGSRSATKQDSVNWVLANYPRTRDMICLPDDKKGNKVYNHDLADAICIGKFLVDVGLKSEKLGDLTNA